MVLGNSQPLYKHFVKFIPCTVYYDIRGFMVDVRRATFKRGF